MTEYSSHNPFVDNIRQRNNDNILRAAAEADVDLEEDDLPIELPSYGTAAIKTSAMTRLHLSNYNCEPRACLAPPDWWYRLSRNQRRIFTVISASFFCALFLTLTASLMHGRRTWSSPNTSSIIIPSSSSTAGDLGDHCSWDGPYLPNSTQPVFYDLRLSINLSEPFSVNGYVDVSISVQADTRCLVLHSGQDLRIQTVTLLGADGQHAMHGKVANGNRSYEQVILEFEQQLPAHGRLRLTFSYLLLEGLDGFYRSSYWDARGVQHTIALTQFQPMAARKALPCFDEPRYRAPFNVTLVSAPSHVALSNMPLVAKIAVAGGLMQHIFQTTPPMAPHLLALVLGELEAITTSCPSMSGELPLAVWATPDKRGQLATALAAACAAVTTFERALRQPYMLPKLDLVGIPNFAAGATENWGLILYRETALLVDPAQDDIQQTFWIADVVAHEIAHQWFGNLVTMADWTELWLSEGFATYLESMGASSFRPSYRYFDMFYTTFTMVALSHDAQESSHPLSLGRPIERPEEVDSLFDRISYEKGAAVLRMLRAFLNRGRISAQWAAMRSLPPELRRRRLLEGQPDRGSASRQQPQHAAAVVTEASGSIAVAASSAGRDPFLEGLHQYLRSNAYGSVTHDMLWNAVGDATGEPVQDWMHTWTLRSGYPLVSIELRNGTPVVSQEPFRADSEQVEAGGGSDAAPLGCDPSAVLGAWWIPLSYTTGSGSQLQWASFNSCSTELQGVKLAGGDDFLLLNIGRLGFFRANYSEELWQRLYRAVQGAGSVTAIDYAGLLDDSWSLSLAGQLPVSNFLDLLSALGTRMAPQYEPWAVALNSLSRIRQLFAQAGMVKQGWQQCSSHLQRYVSRRLTERFISGVRLATDRGPGLTFQVNDLDLAEVRLLRPMVLEAAGVSGDNNVMQSALDIFNEYYHHQHDIPADVRGTVFKLATRSGVATTWPALLQLYKSSRDVNQRQQLLHALAHAQAEELINATLALTLSPDILSQDIGSLLAAVASQGGMHFKLTWAFIAASTDELLARFSGGSQVYSLGKRLESLAQLFLEPADLQLVEQLGKGHPGLLPPHFTSTVRKSITANLRWINSGGQQACKWLTVQLD